MPFLTYNGTDCPYCNMPDSMKIMGTQDNVELHRCVTCMKELAVINLEV
jgi:uncharacterized metal-binding protein (TIGR02443 family)